MVIFPIVIHPVLFFGSNRLEEYGREKLEARPLTLSVSCGIPELAERIASIPLSHITEVEDPRAAVRTGSVDAALVISEAAVGGGEEEEAVPAVLYFDASRQTSQQAEEKLREVIERWRDEKRSERLQALGALPPDELLPVEEMNLASDERMAGGKLGKLIPLLVLFLILNGASFAAVDLFAGERERKTIETLLTSQVDRGSLVVGKFATVVVAALLATLLFLVSSILFARLGWIGPDSGAGFSVPVVSGVVVLIISIPLAILLSAVLVLVSSHARSYREAQTLLLPMMLVAILPATLSMLPGVALRSFISIVPIANVAVAVRDALVGEFDNIPLFLTFFSNLIYAMIVLKKAKSFLTSEGVILGGGRRVSPVLGGERNRAKQVLAFYAVEMLVLYYLGTLVQTENLIYGLLLTLWVFLLLPTLLFARAYRLPLRDSFALRLPSARHLLAGVFLAPAGLLGARAVFQIQERFIPVPVEFMKSFDQLVDGGETGLWLTLFTVAVSPAICEEALFRGVLLDQLRRVFPSWRAVVIGGFLFGLFHLSIYRILPTALLGMLAGMLVVVSGSILPAVVLHGLYNALSILAAHGEPWSFVERSSPLGWAIALSCGALSFLLLRARGKERGGG